MTENSPIPVDVEGTVQLAGGDDRAQLLAVGGVLLALVICLVGVILIELRAGNVPAVLEGATYTLVGALAGMLVTRR